MGVGCAVFSVCCCVLMCKKACGTRCRGKLCVTDIAASKAWVLGVLCECVFCVLLRVRVHQDAWNCVRMRDVARVLACACVCVRMCVRMQNVRASASRHRALHAGTCAFVSAPHAWIRNSCCSASSRHNNGVLLPLVGLYLPECHQNVQKNAICVSRHTRVLEISFSH